MTLCPCKNLGTVLKVIEHQSFFKSLNEIEIGNWVRLMECTSCSQLWAVKEWDKYQIQLATKIPLANRTTWQEANTEGEKEFLIKSRGGLSSEICAWARCGKPCVVGVAYCVNHLYETGIRE